jgi:tRNA (cytidine/uridine-2'-O-)-methyltransferase
MPIKYNEPNFNVVLFEPEIPQNTGNIGRTCVGTQSHLHLIEPLGFAITDKNLKRSGLDYWPDLSWSQHPNMESWSHSLVNKDRVFYFSKKANISYFDVDFQKGDSFVFGRETKGLPEEMLKQNDAQALQIPLYGPIRSLNLATAVAIVLYEGLRQIRSRTM